MNDLSAYRALARALRFWWAITLCALLGAGAGRLFAAVRPPVYEAAAAYSVKVRIPDELLETVNYAEVNDINAAVERRMFSADVWSALQAQAAAQGLPLPETQFDDRVFTLERLRSEWKLIARAGDAGQAADLANLWARAALPYVEESYEHALRAERLRLLRDSAARCFGENDFAAANQCAGLSLQNAGELETYLAGLDRDFQAELEASGHFSAWLEISISTPALPPSAPARFQIAQSVFAGMLIGLLIGIALVQTLPVFARP